MMESLSDARGLALGRVLARSLEGASRVAVLGVGSDLRSDDEAGLIAVDLLERGLSGRGFDALRDRVLILKGCSAPENLTGPIVGFAPSHLVIVDCAELGERPGAARIFPSCAIGGMSSSTHSLPMSVILGYVVGRLGCETIVIGIQPASLDFDGAVGREARAAARRVAAALEGALGRALGALPERRLDGTRVPRRP